jgi:hypothetical protein
MVRLFGASANRGAIGNFIAPRFAPDRLLRLNRDEAHPMHILHNAILSLGAERVLQHKDYSAQAQRCKSNSHNDK